MKKIYYVFFFLLLTSYIYSALPACRTEKLSPKDLDTIWNSAIVSGFEGKSITRGAMQAEAKKAVKKADEEDTPGTEIVLRDKKSGRAVGLTLDPTKQVKSTISLKGNFSYGAILNDTLRVGRCNNLQDKVQCSVIGKGQYLRNSKGSVEIVAESLKEVFTNYNNYESSSEINPKAKEMDDGSVEAVQVKRKESENPVNAIKADNFKIIFKMFCNPATASKQCVLDFYSFFNKYYNTMYSASLAASMGGPVLTGMAGSLFGKVGEYKGLSKLSSIDIPGWFKGNLSNFRKRFFSKDLEVLAKKSAQSVESAAKVFSEEEVKKLFSKAANPNSKEIIEALKPLIEKAKKDAAARKVLQNVLKARLSSAEEAAFLLKGINKMSNKESAEIITKLASDSPNLIGVDIAGDFLKKNYGSLAVKGGAADLTDVALHDFAAKKKLLDSYKHLDEIEAALDNPAELERVLESLPLKRTDVVRLVEESLGNVAAEEDALLNFLRGHPGETLLVKIDGKTKVLNASTAGEIANSAASKGIANIEIFRSTDTPYFTTNREYAEFLQESFKKLKGDVEFKYKTAANNFGKLADFANETGVMNKRYGNWRRYLASSLASKNKFLNIVSEPATDLLYLKLKRGEWLGGISKVYLTFDKDITEVEAMPGDSIFYNGSYFDIFSNKEIGRGDIVEGALSYIRDTIFTISDPAAHSFANFLSMKYRDKTQDLIFYSSVSNEDCDGCLLRYSEKAKRIESSIKGSTKDYVLEMPDLKTYTETGLLLSAFIHRLDFKTYKNDKLQKEVDVSAAVSTGEDCLSKAEQVGYFANTLIPNNPKVLGLFTGIIDNGIGLVPFLPIGLFGNIGASIAVSYLINRQVSEPLEDCIDTIDGYFINMAIAPESNKKKKSFLESIKDNVDNKAKEAKDPLSKVAKQVKDSFVKLVKEKKRDHLQIDFETYGNARQSLFVSDVFLLWMAGNTEELPDTYDDKSRETIQGENGKKIIVDRKSGTLELSDGKKLHNPDFIRMIRKANRIPAYRVPVAMTFIPLLGNSDIFEIFTNADVKVKDPDILACIKDGAYQQAGINLEENSLYPIMGPLKQILLEDNVLIRPVNTAFDRYFEVMKDTGVEEINGNMIVKADRNVIIRGKKDYLLPKIISLTFEKGVIVYKKETNEFIMWIINIASTLGNNIANMTAEHKTVKNAETQCEEDAFDLKLHPLPNDVKADKEVQKMNAALEKIGPLQFFDTPRFRIIFYSKKENGKCKRYMKVIDKKTGKVITDAPVESITKTPDGFLVKTADGKEHKIAFSAENGKPMISYNGEKQPLLMAQGKNGSFWYDPETGKWYVDNAQLIPLDKKFKELGSLLAGNTETPSENPLAAAGNGSKSQSIFDIPLVSNRMLSAIIMLLIGFVFAIYKRED